MGVRILNGDGTGDSQGAALYDSVSGWAFGPLFTDYDEAREFLQWIDAHSHNDPRMMDDIGLRLAVTDFKAQRKVEA